MNALARNSYTEAWAAIGRHLPRPKAILCVSAHWYIPETAVTASLSPRTIHDFGGFPRQLFEVEYPAPGSTELALRVKQLLEPVPVRLAQDWGLDHGTWAVLCHVYPEADVPVVQLSIDETRPPEFHFQLAKLLQPLREEGVLIIGSGNIVHNLHTYAWGKHEIEPFDWAVRFEQQARQLLSTGNFMPLVNYESLGRDALLSAPTPDHYLPLIYVMAQHREGETITFPVSGFDGGSISMLAVQVS